MLGSLLFVVLLSVANGGTCPGSANTQPPWTGVPVKVRSVTNGSLYTAGNGDDSIYILHVYGSPYDMGYAHGVLLKDQINEVFPKFLAHLEKEVESYVKDLPPEFQSIIAKSGLNAALDLTHFLTKKYSSKYFFDEMRGLADGSGIDYNTVVRLHMLPELVKAGCSMLGAWGNALSDESGFLQLRALDWDIDGSLQNAPTVVIYHPDNGHAFANVGWSGWLTTISGMSSKGLAISEKHSDMPFGKESRSGIPFNFLMRDVLQFDESLEDAIKRIQTSHRTCSIWLGVGDGNEKRFRLFEYSYSTANIFDDANVTKIDESRFNREHCDDLCYGNYTLKDMIYWGVHLGCWNEVVHTKYGSIDPLAVIEMCGIVQTGNLQAVVYDLENFDMYVSNAKSDNEQGPVNAYDRQFVKLSMKTLFSESRPLNN